MVGMEAPRLIAEQTVTHIRHGTLRQIFDNQGGVVKQGSGYHRIFVESREPTLREMSNYRNWKCAWNGRIEHRSQPDLSQITED
jgi:hypothetical protein